MEKKTKKGYAPTPEEIAKLKKENGALYGYEVDGLSCILRQPSRKVIEAASVLGQDAPFKFAEVVIQNCWVAGDEELRTEDRYFMGLAQKINEIVEIKVGEVKKL